MKSAVRSAGIIKIGGTVGIAGIGPTRSGNSSSITQSNWWLHPARSPLPPCLGQANAKCYPRGHDTGEQEPEEPRQGPDSGGISFLGKKVLDSKHHQG